MHLPVRAAASVLNMTALAGLCSAQEWTEARVVQQFLEQSPYAREVRARSTIAQAAARSRTLWANPSFNYSRESAGLTEFFQAELSSPISGRLSLLRQAGASSVRATEAGGAFDLWQARTGVRLAFYQLVAAQERDLSDALG